MIDNQTPFNLTKKDQEYYSFSRSEMIGFIPKTARKILDVGCGAGIFATQLKKLLQAEIWGIELDEKSCMMANERLDRALLGDIVELLPSLPNNYFDCIVFNDILEHLIDPYHILMEIPSKLQRDGTIVCSIPNVRFYPVLRDLVLYKQWKYADSGVLDRTHLRFFTITSIKEMFHVLGYEVVRIEGINSIKSKILELINILTCGAFKDAKYLQFACVVRKKAGLS
jgi:2-polyprenyl-3-methyl-5-hydroxy-6-metoxy-1,4-benzoquinol methylase